MIYILYTNNSIIAGSDKQSINETIQQIQQSGLDITIEGDINKLPGNQHYPQQQPISPNSTAIDPVDSTRFKTNTTKC